MLHLVLDTNIRISSLVFGGKPQKVDFFCRPPGFLQIVSDVLMDELREKLQVRFLWTSEQVEAEIANILQSSLLVYPKHSVEICRDPDDNRVLECAMEGRAELIITGDADLLSLVRYKDIRIVTPRQFLAEFSLE